MITKIKLMFLKYKEVLLYLFFGVCTTLVNIVVYYLCDLVGLGTAAATCIAWIISVLFAYITNRLYVFASKAFGAVAVLREAVSFIFYRAVTGVFDLAFMVVAVDLLKGNGLIMKIASNVIVIILNYVFSKLLIFKKK